MISAEMRQNGSNPRVLFIGRKNCDLSNQLYEHIIDCDFSVKAVFPSQRGESFVKQVEEWEGDYIFSFRNLVILPTSLIAKARIAAINFHPGPPEYPGSGGVNFAIYEGRTEFGVTAHLMTDRVDSGPIIQVRRLPIEDSDDLNSLLARTHELLLNLAKDVISEIKNSGPEKILNLDEDLPRPQWSGTRRTIEAVNRLQKINSNIKKKDLERIIRATHLEKFPVKIYLFDYEFILASEKPYDLDGTQE